MTTPSRPTRARQPRRVPGRPGTDSPDLRATLVEAALACFVRDGIAATSLRGIATQAGVTPAMLNYYFGSKLALRDAIFEERLMPAMMQLREGIAGVGDDAQAMATHFVRGVLGLVDTHPWLPSLWVRDPQCACRRFGGLDRLAGGVHVSKIDGPFALSVGSGDVDANDVGSLDAGSIGSGDLKVNGVRGDARVGSIGSGDVTLRNVSNNVRVDTLGSGDLVIRDVQGDLTVGAKGSGDISHSGVKGKVSVPRDRGD